MKTSVIIGLILLSCSLSLSAQKYITRNGFIRFFSEAPLENIEAVNNNATCIVNIETGEVISKILMNAFNFEKALMQEHFNENYVESDKYPQAILKAKVINIKALDFTSNAEQDVELEGEMTIHNVTQPLAIKGKIIVNKKTINISSNFIVKTADYQIKIPKAVKDNIAKEIEVNLKFKLEEL